MITLLALLLQIIKAINSLDENGEQRRHDD